MDAKKRQKLDSMWTDLGDELAKERQSLENDRKELLAKSEKLEAEKEAMSKSGVTDCDVLELNVGGEMFMVQRGTLLRAPEDSHLYAMFSGRWDESLSRSKEGAIFVDMSPHVFRTILSRLRGSKLQAEAPRWRDLRASDPIYQYELKAVLKFFGLIDPVPPVTMKTSRGGIVVVDGCVLTKSDGPSQASAVSSEEIAIGSVWKIHIKSLVNTTDCWIFAGIIGLSTTPGTDSFSQSTSFGWACLTEVYLDGKERKGKDEWVGWEAGDMAVFKLESTHLKMYHTRLGRSYMLQLPSESAWKVHLNMYDAGSEVEVLMPTEQEADTLN